MTRKQARTIIASLLDAEHCTLLASMQDGGQKVDIIWSRNALNKVMTLAEAEKIMDAAIRSAFKTMTGFEIKPCVDPVEFINS